MDIRFDGKRALVTGAGKGIGRCLALKLAELGAEVVAVSRTESDLDSLKKEFPTISTLCMDISKWDATKTALEDTVGPIDLLVNNAAVLLMNPYGDLTEEEINKSFDTNVKAIINITQLIAKGMKARGQGGSIVNLSSMLGLQVAEYYSVYGATKGAVDQLTRSMAVEFGPHKIRVNSVNPTVVRTAMTINSGIYENEVGQQMLKRTPLRRFAEVEDIVYPILFLLSDKASMITGITMPIDGGLQVNYP